MKILILSTDAGGGHRMTATALSDVLVNRHGCNVRIVNPYIELFSDSDWCEKICFRRSEELYNEIILGKSWGSSVWPLLAFFFSANINIGGYLKISRYAKLWMVERPDVVVSVMPMVNRCVSMSMKKSFPSTPFVTVITDSDERFRSTWIVSDHQYLICGTERLLNRARKRRHPENRLLKTSGLVIRPSFSDCVEIDIPSQRALLGLRSDLPTGIVQFGGYTSDKMLRFAQSMNQADLAVQFIFLCGHNRQLAARLDQMETSYPKYITGYIDNVASLLALGDFMVGKPGPGFISEAMAMNLPMVLEINGKTLMQEKYWALQVIDSGFGFAMRRVEEGSAAIKTLLDHDPAKIRRSMEQRQPNRAVFEASAYIVRLGLDSGNGNHPYIP